MEGKAAGRLSSLDKRRLAMTRRGSAPGRRDSREVPGASRPGGGAAAVACLRPAGPLVLQHGAKGRPTEMLRRGSPGSSGGAADLPLTSGSEQGSHSASRSSREPQLQTGRIARGPAMRLPLWGRADPSRLGQRGPSHGWRKPPAVQPMSARSNAQFKRRAAQ